MFKRKAISMFLAFTLFLGCIPNINLKDVYASVPLLNLFEDESLSIGGNNDTPSYSTTGQPQKAFMFGWDASKLDLNESTTLDYWFLSKVKMVVSTQKESDNTYKVDIKLQNETGTPITVTDANYTIYNNLDKQYLTIDKYFAGDDLTPSTTYNDYEAKKVLGEGTTGTSKVASFRLTNKDSDVGYSIRYNGYELHFLLGQDGSFKFYQIGSFDVGRFYYANLTHSNGTSVESRPFSVGLNLEEVYTNPFVNVNDSSNVLERKEYAENKYNIENRNSVSVDDNDGVGFDYSIELPYEYDTTANTFTKKASKDISYTVTFSKGSTSGAGSAGTYISVTVNVAADGTATIVQESTTQPAGAVIEVEGNAVTNNILKLNISGLNSGMLLSPNIVYSANQAVIKDGYGQVENKAYTFPEYEIITNDGADYVSITPFAGYAGDYVLYSGTAQNEPIDRFKLSYSARFFKENAGSTDKIWLPLSPVDVSGDKTYIYKIFFNPNKRFANPESIKNNDDQFNKVVKTRYFEYTARDKGTIGFPNDFEIKNLNQSKMFNPDQVNYKTDGNGYYVENFQDTSYTLGWDLGKVTSIDKMFAVNNGTTSGSAISVSYDLKLGEEIDKVDSPFLKINFNILSTGVATQAILDPSTPFTATFTKNGTNPKNPLNKVIDARMTTVYSTQSSSYVYRLEIDLENVAIDANKITNPASNAAIVPNLYFQYPNIYFFKVSPIISGSSGSVSSTVKSLTLNKDTAVELKEPIKVNTSNMVTQFIGGIDAMGQTVTKDRVSLDLNYEQQQATFAQYMNYYFTNYDLAHYGQYMQFTNDIYVSQDYDLMSKTIPDLSKVDRDKLNVVKEFVFDPTSKNVDGNYTAMMRAFANNANATNKDPNPITLADGTLGIDVLRDGGIVKISGVPMYTPTFDSNGNYVLPTSNVVNKFQVNGLDTNAKYYFYVDTNVVYKSTPNSLPRYLNQNQLSTETLKENSGISALTSGTTGSNLQMPNILDEVPVMPDLTLLETGRNSYKMTWQKVDMTISDTNRYEQDFQYEVLRLRDTKLADKYLDSRQELKAVFENQIDAGINDKSAQWLYRDPITGKPVVKKYVHDKTASDYNTFTDKYDAGLYLQQYDDDNGIIYDDNSLSANKVYFIYARTVRVIKDNVTGKEYKIYSPWDVISATTVLGEAPIDLRVVYNYDKAYNPQTQIPLSFRAKVPQINTIGTDITFQVTYQYDGKEWVTPITIDSATLQNSATIADSQGYKTFTFLLSNLIPGKSYNIKVRQANADGSFTNYSNTVQWKTEIDEDEYDKNDEVGAFEDLMDERVDNLIDGSQVVLENNESEKIIMINGNNLANEITNSKANTITINTLEKGKDNTILIPFEAYQTANNKGMAWQFTNGDMFFNYSAKTIDPTYNTQVIALNKKIERDVVEDYYMEFVFDYQSNPSKLGNDDRLTDVIKLSNVLKATNENVIDFQEYALKEALEEVKNTPAVLARKQAVLDKIAAGMYAEDALKLVDNYVAYVQGLLQDNLNARISKIQETRDDLKVGKLDKSIIMGTNYQNVLSKVTAYNVNGNTALPMVTTRTTNVTTTTVKDYGTYGFGGNVVSITGTIPNQSGNNNVTGIIAVNDLEDTLTSTGSPTVSTTTDMTVSQALTAMSNTTGMTDAEVKSLLNDKGVTINRNNESKKLTEDLGVAMVAVIYEQVNGINPDKIAIKDYTFYNKVKSSGTNSGYVKHIQLAKEVGIITSVPSTSKTTTVGDFLGMLSKAQ